MNGDDSGEQETPPDEEKKVEDANLDVGQGSLKYDELEVNWKINIGGETGQGSLQSQDFLQQSQGTPFCWERFLHIRTIKVLLVEYDDSTRHVVAALLRKCNYEVIEASNGLQAWKVLEDLTNHVDLILSEVVTPCVSGVGLLCKIMSHKSHKNIPIIMMSSHDSMGLVFKCLTKGAVDFLVKPIRKNELKNLWQHVWRRSHSSSGSGSESGSVSHNQKSTKSKGIEKSENHSGSNDKEDDKSNGMNIGYGSDAGSGAQSSWTKQPTEVDSSQEISPIDETSDFEDSTCAQVRCSNAEVATINQFQATSAGNCLQLLQPDFRGLVACKSVKVEVKPDAIEVASNHISAQKNAPLEIEPKIDGNMKHESLECPNVDYRQVVCTTTSGPDIEVNRSGSFLGHADRRDEMDDTPKSSGKPTLELSLKHPRGSGEAGEDVNILSHSELSAFSRYNASTAFMAPNGIDITGSSSVIYRSLDGGKKELEFDMHFHSNDTCPHPSSKRGSNTSDISSTTNKLLPSPLIVLTESPSIINGLHTSCTLKPVKDSERCSTQEVNIVNQSDVQSSILFAPAGESHQQLSIQQPHHHHHHHYHINHFHNFESDPQMSNNQELSQRKSAADASLCGKSNVPGGPDEASPLNYSLDQSASGSNYGSNGHNGSSNAVNASGANGESYTGINLRSGNANSSGSGNRLDQDRPTQREATLANFRQKRKERRSEKQVRFTNRKRLAEMRPHVQGQFVRQMEQDDSSSYEADEL